MKPVELMERALSNSGSRSKAYRTQTTISFEHGDNAARNAYAYKGSSIAAMPNVTSIHILGKTAVTLTNHDNSVDTKSTNVGQIRKRAGRRWAA